MLKSIVILWGGRLPTRDKTKMIYISLIKAFNVQVVETLTWEVGNQGPRHSSTSKWGFENRPPVSQLHAQTTGLLCIPGGGGHTLLCPYPPKMSWSGCPKLSLRGLGVLSTYLLAQTPQAREAGNASVAVSSLVVLPSVLLHMPSSRNLGTWGA